MSTTTVTARWIELANGMLGDPTDARRDERTQYYLFINRCEVRTGKRGAHVVRTLDVEELLAHTRDELDEMLAAYVERPDVRLLRPELEVNDFKTLPHEEPATEALLNGTAPIYYQLPDDPDDDAVHAE